jgi:hypothetical protein
VRVYNIEEEMFEDFILVNNCICECKERSSNNYSSKSETQVNILVPLPRKHVKIFSKFMRNINISRRFRIGL